MALAPNVSVKKLSDPPRRRFSGARVLGALLCLAAGGVAAHELLQKAPADTAASAAATTDGAATEPAPADIAATEQERVPFRLPALTDPPPRPAFAPAHSTTSWAESLDPLAPRTPVAAEPAPPAGIERSQVLTVAGSDGADAGPLAESPPAEPPLPLAETVPLAQTPSDGQQPDAQPPAIAAPGELCGLVTCASGFGCCNPSCGVCVAPGENCDPTPCENEVQYPVSGACGRSTCSIGQVCCNPSCGTCVSPGESCDSALCDRPIQYPFSPICGRVTCSIDQECCNPSCGICVAPGQTCSQQPCR